MPPKKPPKWAKSLPLDSRRTHRRLTGYANAILANDPTWQREKQARAKRERRPKK